MNEETGLDINKLREKVPPSWDFIFDLDMVSHHDEAIALMDGMLRSENRFN